MHADPTKERKRRAHNRYYASAKGKENRKGADARFRESHREERNKYNRNYYQAHKEYFAEYQKKISSKEGRMSKKISVHVDLMKSNKELDEILDKCTPTLDKIAKEAANNYEKQLLQYAVRNKAKQVYVVRKMGLDIETSCWKIDLQFFTDKEVACTYARMNKSSSTCEIIGHELGQIANLPDDVFESIPDDGNKDLAVEYRRVMREEG